MLYTSQIPEQAIILAKQWAKSEHRGSDAARLQIIDNR